MLPVQTDELDLVDLRESLEEALWRYEPVRTASRELRVRVQPDGTVEISGWVRSSFSKDVMLDIARHHPGVQQVIDSVVCDPDVELAVARALAQDERTKTIPPGAVQSYSHYGVVTLAGRLPEGVAREPLLEVARGVEGVEQVVDRLASA